MASEWRGDFPILASEVCGRPLTYLDNAATSQMPRAVIERMVAYYEGEHANIHRGVHFLSERATGEVETVRRQVAAFIGAEQPEEVVFTSGATEGLNMAALGLVAGLPAGSAVVVSDLEHHSNYVPWQQACRERGLEFCVCPSQDGELDLDALDALLAEKDVRVVAITQVSNLTGTVMPLERIAEMAHGVGAVVVVDGAQGVLHEGVDVAATGVDFYAFSGHKMCGPTGIGVLYGRRRLLEELSPTRFGGGMVDVVGETETSWGALPLRLEAGTPNIVGIIGLGAAIDYLEGCGLDRVRAFERELLAYAEERVGAVEGVQIVGHPRRRCGLLSLVVDGLHPFDVAFMLDKMGVAVRSGHHCAQPGLRSLGLEATVRASIAFYNDRSDIDRLCEGLARVRSLVG